MTQKEFIKKVRKQLGKYEFHYWSVEHLIKAGVIEPLRKGRGRPREFSHYDVEKAVEYYSNR